MVSGDVLTAAPVEAEPRPLTAIWLVSWLRTAWLGSSDVAALVNRLTEPVVPWVADTVGDGAMMACVACAPLIAPPEVLT